MSQTLDFVIKFGGSAITCKSQLETPNDDELMSACVLMKKCAENNLRFIIVHGAGSFGHHQASEYSVNGGYRHLQDGKLQAVKTGFCKTRESLLKLNQMVTSCLIDQGLNAVSLPPCSGWRVSNSRVIEDSVAMVTAMLDEGFIPVLHGDCVLDREKGCSILSGDTVIKTICSHLVVDRVVFLMDVEGFYDKHPLHKDAKLIEDITVKSSSTMDFVSPNTSFVSPNTSTISTDQSSVPDVTGGIKLKVQSAVDIVTSSTANVLVFMCKIGSMAAHNASLYGDLRGEKGTIIWKG